jgi:hypothetical protein
MSCEDVYSVCWMVLCFNRDFVYESFFTLINSVVTHIF